MTEPLLCPHCEEPTLPNRLADGSVVCSCAAERDISEAAASRAGASAAPGSTVVQMSAPQAAGYQPNPSPSAATWPRPGKGKW